MRLLTRNKKVRCVLCGQGVTANDPGRYPYCHDCHFGGAVEEFLRAAQIRRFAQAFPNAEVLGARTPHGGYELSLAFAGGVPGSYTALAFEASLPYDVHGYEPPTPHQPRSGLCSLPGGGWGHLKYTRYGGWSPTHITLLDATGEGENLQLSYPLETFGDEAVIDAIRRHREPAPGFYVVERLTDGEPDWRVRKAYAWDEAHDVVASLPEAREKAARLAAEDGGRWFDVSDESSTTREEAPAGLDALEGTRSAGSSE